MSQTFPTIAIISSLFAPFPLFPFLVAKAGPFPDSGARPDRSSHNHDLIHSTSFLFLLRRDGSHLCLQVRPIVCHCLSLFGHLSLYLRSPFSKVDSQINSSLFPSYQVHCEQPSHFRRLLTTVSNSQHSTSNSCYLLEIATQKSETVE